LAFRRRTSTGATNYIIWESDDLDTWWTLDLESRIQHSFDNGDDTENVQILGAINLKDPDGPGKGFLKLEIN